VIVATSFCLLSALLSRACVFSDVILCYLLQLPNSGSDGACFRSLGRVQEPQAKRSAEVCIGPPGVRDSHVYMTQTSPVELYVNHIGAGSISSRENEYLVVFTGGRSRRFTINFFRGTRHRFDYGPASFHFVPTSGKRLVKEHC
jgi:hypothetical protein